jgi:hypothetical protein
MRVLTLTHELPPVGGGGGRIAVELARQTLEQQPGSASVKRGWQTCQGSSR